MRDLNRTERRVNIDLSHTEMATYTNEGRTVLRFYDKWDCNRKKQPVFEMEITPGELSYLANLVNGSLRLHQEAFTRFMAQARKELE
jgi:hypothetical protein